jgi:hypothetical protein
LRLNGKRVGTCGLSTFNVSLVDGSNARQPDLKKAEVAVEFAKGDAERAGVAAKAVAAAEFAAAEKKKTVPQVTRIQCWFRIFSAQRQLKKLRKIRKGAKKKKTLKAAIKVQSIFRVLVAAGFTYLYSIPVAPNHGTAVLGELVMEPTLALVQNTSLTHLATCAQRSRMPSFSQ